MMPHLLFLQWIAISVLGFDRPGIELHSSAEAFFVVNQRQLALQCRYVVAFMALVGISTALLVNMLGQARIFTMAAREHLIPIFWARVSPRYGTPIAAQITMGAASGQRSHPQTACRCLCWNLKISVAA